MATNKHFLIAGAGIAGLGAALALGRRGHQVTLLEQAVQLGEVGAGVQLGPNAMRVLAHWGLADAVLAKACLPQAVAVRAATSGRSISRMLLGAAIAQRDGAAYATMHRADLHAALLQAVQALPQVQMHLGQRVQSIQWDASGVQVRSCASKNGATDGVTYSATDSEGSDWQADALLGADGLWSAVRPALCGDAAPRATGHIALRAMLPASAACDALKLSEVGVWWGEKLHVVHYAVSGGDWFNVVVLTEGLGQAAASQGWALDDAAQMAQATQTIAALQVQMCPDLQSILAAAQSHGFKLWHLYDRPAAPFQWSQALALANQTAQGSALTAQRPPITLLGDAAHPMLPYLAQGAAMALEDAAVLAACVDVASSVSNVAGAFTQYEAQRSARTARVVRTAKRNGQIFHLGWPWSVARDAVLALKGTQTVGLPWLYGFDALQ